MKKIIYLLALHNLLISTVFGNFYFNSSVQKNSATPAIETARYVQSSSAYPYIKGIAPFCALPVFFKSQQILGALAHEMGHLEAITRQQLGIIKNIKINWNGTGKCIWFEDPNRYVFPMIDSICSFPNDLSKKILRQDLIRNLSGPMAGLSTKAFIGAGTIIGIESANQLNDVQKTTLISAIAIGTLSSMWRELYDNLIDIENLSSKMNRSIKTASDGTQALWNLYGINPKYAENYWKLSQKIINSKFIPKPLPYKIRTPLMITAVGANYLGNTVIKQLEDRISKNVTSSTFANHSYQNSKCELVCPPEFTLPNEKNNHSL